MVETSHPTAQKLIETVSSMLDGENPNDILVDEVLKISGVSRGSLYHHFGDFPGLIECTLLSRFTANVEADGKAMRKIAEAATTKEEYWSRIRKLSANTQLPSRAPARAERARLISLATSGGEFAEALAAAQDRLTDELAASITHAQAKGWVNPRLSPRAIALFLQAYSLGRAIDDVAGTHVSNKEWIELIDAVLTSFEA